MLFFIFLKYILKLVVVCLLCAFCFEFLLLFIRYVVLDEADRMLDMGFQESLDDILSFAYTDGRLLFQVTILLQIFIEHQIKPNVFYPIQETNHKRFSFLQRFHHGFERPPESTWMKTWKHLTWSVKMSIKVLKLSRCEEFNSYTVVVSCQSA